MGTLYIDAKHTKDVIIRAKDDDLVASEAKIVCWANFSSLFR